MWEMFKNCDADRYAVNKERMVRLAEYSRDCIRALRRDTGIDYEGRQQGTLQLFRTQAQFDGAAKDIEVLRQAGVPFEVLSPRAAGPRRAGAGRVRDKLVGGLRLPNDETGDCQLFTTRLPRWRGHRRALRIRRRHPRDRIAGRPDHRRAHRQGPSPPTATWSRWAAIRACCCASSSACRCIR
jgi:hypothetical protein